MEYSTFNTTLVTPNHVMVFGFETSFDGNSKKEWMKRNWQHAFYYSVAYLLLIFAGQKLMTKYTPFNLRVPLIIWNASLCLFSMFGAVRTITEIVHVLVHFGFDYSVCSTSYLDQGQVTDLWVWLFVVSKLVELGDTAFIILRKQKLIFLQWYHHVATLIYTWFAYTYPIAPFRWFIAINFLTHSIMYCYFLARIMRVKLPRAIPIAITTCQIIQFIFALFVIYYSHKVYMHDSRCMVRNETTIASFVVYITNCVLFLKFFYDKYISKKDRIKKLKAT